MKESDQLATSFITPFDMYCYVTMPFGLRNAGATALLLCLTMLCIGTVAFFIYTFYDKKLDASLEEEGAEPEEPFLSLIHIYGGR